MATNYLWTANLFIQVILHSPTSMEHPLQSETYLTCRVSKVIVTILLLLQYNYSQYNNGVTFPSPQCSILHLLQSMED